MEEVAGLEEVELQEGAVGLKVEAGLVAVEFAFVEYSVENLEVAELVEVVDKLVVVGKRVVVSVD